MNPDPSSADAPENPTAYVRRHLRFGWHSLLVYLSLGLVLEALHGLKIGWYLDVSNDVRRLTWTLAHAHDVLLGLVHIAFGLTLRAVGGEELGWQRVASPCLVASSVLLPGGFLLGGFFAHGGDPGLGILFVPVGDLLLIVGVALATRSLSAALGTMKNGR